MCEALLSQLLQPNWRQMYWFTTPLDHVSEEERGALLPGQHRVSIYIAQASCALERKLQLHCEVKTQHGRLAVTGYKPFLVWRRDGRQGLPPSVGEMFILTGQLPPALSWAAPSQLGAAPPQPACFIGCMKLRDSS